MKGYVLSINTFYIELEFSQRKFQYSNFPLYSFYKRILSNLISVSQPILVYTYIYIYTHNNPPLGCNNICLT